MNSATNTFTFLLSTSFPHHMTFHIHFCNLLSSHAFLFSCLKWGGLTFESTVSLIATGVPLMSALQMWVLRTIVHPQYLCTDTALGWSGWLNKEAAEPATDLQIPFQSCGNVFLWARPGQKSVKFLTTVKNQRTMWTDRRKRDREWCSRTQTEGSQPLVWALSHPSQKRWVNSMVNFHSFCSCCWDAIKTAVTDWETGRTWGEQQHMFLLGKKSSGYHASDKDDIHRESIENCSVRSLLRRGVGRNGWEFKKRNSEQKMDLCLEERH